MDPCPQFLSNPTVNPFTGRNITVNGPTYKKLAKQCGEPQPLAGHPTVRYISTSQSRAQQQMTPQQCEEFRRNPTINPITGRQIDAGGATYKRLAKQCGFTLPQQYQQQPKRKAQQMNPQQCQEFMRNPSVNPMTGRQINPQGVTYKRLAKQCGLRTQPQQQFLPQQFQQQQFPPQQFPPQQQFPQQQFPPQQPFPPQQQFRAPGSPQQFPQLRAPGSPGRQTMIPQGVGMAQQQRYSPRSLLQKSPELYQM